MSAILNATSEPHLAHICNTFSPSGRDARHVGIEPGGELVQVAHSLELSKCLASRSSNLARKEKRPLFEHIDSESMFGFGTQSNDQAEGEQSPHSPQLTSEEVEDCIVNEPPDDYRSL
jgi:hypothetical protein